MHIENLAKTSKLHVLAFAFAVLGATGAATALAQESALPPLRDAARAAPKDVAAQLALGRALIEAGRLGEADAQMKKAVRLDPNSVPVLFEALRVKFAEGHYKKVRAGCRELAKVDANHVLTHVCNARALLVWRRSSRAFEHIDRALTLDPNNYEAALAQADAKRQQGDFADADTAYQRAITLSSKPTDAQLGRGLLYLVQRKGPEAIAALRKALASSPRDPDVAFELGRALVDSGKAQEGMKLLQQAAADRSQWDDAELHLAVAQLKAGRAAEAEAGLEVFLKRHKEHPIATAQYGAALVAVGKFEKAEAVLGKALTLIPNDYDTAFALAQLYERTDRHEEAFTQYRGAADLKRESPQALVAAASLGLRLGRTLLAGALLDKALEREPRSGEALGYYGDVLAARGDRKAAREFYQRALAGEGDFDRVRIQRKLDGLK